MDVLLMRFDAPMMSFGAPVVDNLGKIQPYPALSMICGLLGNALGYHHGEFARLGRLQERLQYASRRDRPGRQVQDYQTVALGQDHLLDDRAWTTRGVLHERAGGNSTGTHIRYRDYWAEAVHTVAVTLEPADEAPTLDALERALDEPARPLFIGRKTCLPATPIRLGRLEADDLVEALRHAPWHKRSADEEPPERLHAWWPTTARADEDRAMKKPVTDARDWANQIHVGERWIAHGDIALAADAICEPGEALP